MVTKRLIINLATLITLLAGTISANAQDDQLPSWCPLAVTTPSSIPESPVKLEDDLLTFQTDDGSIVLDDSGIVTAYALSPDQSQIAIIRLNASYNSELVVINSDGTNERQLLSPDDIATLRTDELEGLKTGIDNLQWLSSNTLIFNSYLHVVGEGLFIFVADDLLTINTETAELTILLAQGDGGEYHVSPDGNWIAVMTPDSLSFITPDASQNQMDILPDYTANGFGEYYVYPTADWTFDSSALLVGVSSGDNPYSQHEGMITLWSVPTDGSEPTAIANFRAFYPTFAVSPDLEFVAFWNAESQTSNTRTIVIARLDGSEEYAFLTGRLIDFNGWTSEFGHFIFTDETQTRFLGDICGGHQPLPATN